MRVEFYQVPLILLNNSSYLGELSTITDRDLNVNLNDLRSIELTLPRDYIKYNYIKIIDVNYNYFFILDNHRYSGGNMVRIFYRIDILRTLKDFNDLDYPVRLNKYSGLLPLENKQSLYFWKNQSIKLGGNVVSDYIPIIPPIKEHDPRENYILRGTDWIYIWLQPKPEMLENDIRYQYKFKRSHISLDVVEIITSQLPELNQPYTMDFGTGISSFPPLLEQYGEGTILHDLDEDLYYVIKQKMNPKWQQILMNIRIMTRWVEATVAPVDKVSYAITELNPIDNEGVSIPLYALVFPTTTLKYTYWNTNGDSVSLMWGINEILPYLNDPVSENSWANNIVDLKISKVPPIDLSDVQTSNHGLQPTISQKQLKPLGNLHHNVKKFNSEDFDINNLVENDIFIPSVLVKPSGLVEVESQFNLDTLEVNKESLIYDKYYLSVLEDRVELDVSLLKHNGAINLLYYEDITPGRSNVLLGYVPKGELNEQIKYLIHSPSTLSLDRDLSLPLFTSDYSDYLSTNKNFMAQAELSRKTQLTQGLINSGAQTVGAAAVSLTMPGYNPINAVARAAGGVTSSIVTYQAQNKQFNWNLDNIKSSPGSYKAANSTLMTRFNLKQTSPWITKMTSSEFDIELYEQLLEEVGYEYFDYKFSLKTVLNNLLEDYNKPLGLIQGRLTGLGLIELDVDLSILLNILHEKLQEGIGVYK